MHELHLVYRVYDLARPTTGLPPTPRDLKLFVNQIGAVHRQWGDRFPLPHVAYYAILFMKRPSVLNYLRQRPLPDQKIERLLGENVIETLAALAFNTEVEKARELLLLDDLKNALQEGNVGGLQEIADKHPDGVWLVMERVPFAEWAVSESENLAMTARALQKVDFANRAPEEVVRSVIDSLSAAFQAVEQWEYSRKDTGEGIAAILKLDPDVELASSLISSVSESAPKVVEETTIRDIDQWWDTQVTVLHAAWNLGPDEVLGEGVLIPGNAAWCVRVCSRLVEDPDSEKYIPFLKTDVGGGEITEHLKQNISQGDLNTDDSRGFNALQRLSSEINWEEIALASFQRLNTAGSYEPGEIIALQSVLWDLRNSLQVASDRLKQLTNQGFILHHLHHARTKASSDATAWCMFTHLHMRPESSPPPNQIGNTMDGWNYLNSALKNPSDHEELLIAFNRVVARYEQHGLLLLLVDRVPDSKPWVVASIEEIVQSGHTLKLLSSAEYIARHEFLKAELDEDIYTSAVNALVGESDLLTQIREGAFDPDRAELYLDVLGSGGAQDKNFNKWLSDGLKGVDADTWHGSFNDETYLLDLMVERYDRGGKFSLGIAFRDGLQLYTEGVIRGEADPQDPILTSGSFFKVLWKDDRAIARRRLLDSVKEADGVVAPPFFDLFGDEIAELEGISDDREVVLRLFEPIVRKRNQRGLEWLADLLEKKRDLLVGYEPEYAMTEFRARVEETVKQDTGEDIRAPLERIAEVLGIEIAVL